MLPLVFGRWGDVTPIGKEIDTTALRQRLQTELESDPGRLLDVQMHLQALEEVWRQHDSSMNDFVAELPGTQGANRLPLVPAVVPPQPVFDKHRVLQHGQLPLQIRTTAASAQLPQQQELSTAPGASAVGATHPTADVPGVTAAPAVAHTAKVVSLLSSQHEAQVRAGLASQPQLENLQDNHDTAHSCAPDNINSGQCAGKGLWDWVNILI